MQRPDRRLCSLVGVAFVLTMTLTAAPAPIRQPASTEVRGLWVLRTSLTSPASIAAMVKSAKASGFNTLLLQVRGRGEAFYTSEIEPRATDLEGQPASFDPLATAIAQAHREGLRVHAWINVNLVASAARLPKSPRHVARQHPEWLMVPRALAPALRRTDPGSPAYLSTLSKWSRTTTNGVEGVFLSPLVPAAQDHTVAVVREIAARYDLDGIHFDYVRFPSTEFDYGTRALAEFRSSLVQQTPAAERQRLDTASAKDPLAWTKQFPAAWTTFRHDRLSGLVARLSTAVREARPGAIVSAAVFPDINAARKERLQDWLAWASAGYLDVVCPMIYTTDPAEFTTQVRQAHAALGSTPLWAGIGAYRLSVSTTAGNVRTARRTGAAGIVLFSYDSLVSSSAPARGYLSAIRPVLLEPGGAGSHE